MWPDFGESVVNFSADHFFITHYLKEIMVDIFMQNENAKKFTYIAKKFTVIRSK